MSKRIWILNIVLTFVLVFGVQTMVTPMQAAGSQLQRPNINLQDEDGDKTEGEQDSDSKSEPQESDDQQAVEDAEADKSESADKESQSSRSSRNRSRRDQMFRNGETMRSLFADVAGNASQSTVIVRSGRRQIAFGTIVDSNGFVLTKKSELQSNLICELADGSEFAASVFGVHEPTDLALLKIEKKRLKPVVWNTDDPLSAGSWLITTNPEGEAESIGVISVAPRVIKGGHGFMGISMDTTYPGPGAKVTDVTAKSPAERAKFKAGDVIIRVGTKEIADSQELREAVSSKSPGDQVKMTVKRGSNTIELKIILGSHLDLNPQMDRANFQNNMGGRLSRRRYDFPLAFQHDSVLAPNQCGGPVLNLAGEVIGLNVARNGRVASLALPVSVIMPVIEELMSGNLAPAVVNKSKIEEINQRLNQIEITLATDPNSTQEMEADLVELKEAEKKAEQAVQDAWKKAKEASNAAAKLEAELNIIKERLKKARAEKEQLEREREDLVTGAG